jgi:hypothetical protein
VAAGMARHAKTRWTQAWLGGAGIGVVNGIAREKVYGPRVSEGVAHQLSTATAIVAFAAYFTALERRWPIATGEDAAVIGARWLAMTVAFEFAFGRLVAKLSWRQMLADYDVRRGRTWPVVLAWTAAGPAIVRRSQMGETNFSAT